MSYIRSSDSGLSDLSAYVLINRPVVRNLFISVTLLNLKECLHW